MLYHIQIFQTVIDISRWLLRKQVFQMQRSVLQLKTELNMRSVNAHELYKAVWFSDLSLNNGVRFFFVTSRYARSVGWLCNTSHINLSPRKPTQTFKRIRSWCLTSIMAYGFWPTQWCELWKLNYSMSSKSCSVCNFWVKMVSLNDVGSCNMTTKSGD